MSTGWPVGSAVSYVGHGSLTISDSHLTIHDNGAAMTSETVTGARRELGILLARSREAAGYTQASLAHHIGYSRSTVANAEVGQGAARHFWEKVDRLVHAEGELLAAFEQVETARLRSRSETEPAGQEGHDAKGVLLTPAVQGLSALAPTDHADHVLLGTLDSTMDDHSSAARLTSVIDDDLKLEVLDAYQRRAQRKRPPLSLTIVGGYAGSGKSEFARFLAAVTGWTILDKDTLTRALVEQLLISFGSDPNDRETDVYQKRVRSHEYRCLLDQGAENLDCGVSVILTAPFLREITDVSWLGRVRNLCTVHRAAFHVVWVRCDTDSMRDYLSFRGASRDAWKLAHWTEYLNGIDVNFEPDFPHYLVDNRLNAAVALAEQATDIAGRIFGAL
jgi:predicted kinase/DNA-binding XRE family transcriptional regulator